MSYNWTNGEVITAEKLNSMVVKQTCVYITFNNDESDYGYTCDKTYNEVRELINNDENVVFAIRNFDNGSCILTTPLIAHDDLDDPSGLPYILAFVLDYISNTYHAIEYRCYKLYSDNSVFVYGEQASFLYPSRNGLSGNKTYTLKLSGGTPQWVEDI